MTHRESCDMGTSLQPSSIDMSIDIREECSYTAEDRSSLAGREKDPNQVRSAVAHSRQSTLTKTMAEEYGLSTVVALVKVVFAMGGAWKGQRL